MGTCFHPRDWHLDVGCPGQWVSQLDLKPPALKTNPLIDVSATTGRIPTSYTLNLLSKGNGLVCDEVFPSLLLLSLRKRDWEGEEPRIHVE